MNQSQDISAIMRKILSLLWLKSDKNVKQTKVEKSRYVSNCLDKGSLTSQRSSRWITFKWTEIFLIRDLEAKTEPRKKNYLRWGLSRVSLNTDPSYKMFNFIECFDKKYFSLKMSLSNSLFVKNSVLGC